MTAKYYYIFFIILSCVLSVEINAQNQSNITQDSALEIVKKDILHNDLRNINVFVSRSIIRANSRIQTIHRDKKAAAFD